MQGIPVLRGRIVGGYRHHAEGTLVEFGLFFDFSVDALGVVFFDLFTGLSFSVFNVVLPFEKGLCPFDVDGAFEIVPSWIERCLRFSMYIFLRSTLYPCFVKLASMLQ